MRRSARTLTLASVALVSGLALAACGSADDNAAGNAAGRGTADAATTSTAASAPQELRDVRYCEVIVSEADGANVDTSVYNTLGYNLCPPEKWNALTEDEVNAEYGSQAAKLNGPRHWVIDNGQGTGSSETGKTFTFGDIEMGLRGTLTTPAGQPTVGDQFYVPNQVSRDTIWTYDAAKPVYELVSPEGDVYVMQSYAQIADPTLTIKQLSQLASKLELPDGWTYKTETLTEPLVLNSNGLATVVNDNLYNSYQKRS
jgi:hypothetical protein